MMQKYRNTYLGIVGLCLSAIVLGGFPISCEKKSTFQNLFARLSPEYTGVDFSNDLVYTEDFNAYLYRSFYNGGGVALSDFNNDGNLDLFFSGNQVDNKLYLGDGEFHFKDVTNEAGVASPNAWSTGVSVIDINQDGLLDIYICKSGKPTDRNRRNELFVNQGTNTDGIPVFKEEANKYGIDNLGFSIHAQFFDYDRDGDMDMYLSNNSISPTDMIVDVKKGMREIEDMQGGDKLYKNENGRFIEVTQEANIYSSSIGFGLGVAIGDVNRDGWPDIYVANDFFEKDYLYINQKDGTFTESSDQYLTEISMGSMGVDIVDLDHDGFPEIFVTEMLPREEKRLKTTTAFDDWDKYNLKVKNGYHHQFSRNTLQLNKGWINDGQDVIFNEISRYAGIDATDWSWGVQMVDLSLDGKNEIFVTNGIAKDLLDQDYIDFYFDPQKIKETLQSKGSVIKELIDHIPVNPLANYLFKQGDNMLYSNVSKEWGLDDLGFSSGAAYGDIDNDGDLDLVVSNINDNAFIYRNESVERLKNNFLSLSIKNHNGTDAIGAQVTALIDGQIQFKELFSMRGSMSSVESRLVFGLGKHSTIDTLRIVWPNGKQQIKTNVKGNQFLSLADNSIESSNALQSTRKKKPLFSEVKAPLKEGYKHREIDFSDFDKERLLYQMISNEGPKIAIADIDNDGYDDFYIGGAKQQPGAVYVFNNGGYSKKINESIAKDSLSEDMGSLFFDANNDGLLDLFVSSGSNEFLEGSFALLDRLYINNGNAHFSRKEDALPIDIAHNSSIAVALDFDSDGDQDLFVATRSITSTYGLCPSSYLLENDGNGVFSHVKGKNATIFKDLGMVTDALAVDYDRDGDSDLLVVGEWMPVKLFTNENGFFIDSTEKFGLAHTNGLYNTVEEIDIEKDGFADFVLGNLGLNTMLKAGFERPLKMYVNDFDSNGSMEQVVTSFNGKKAFPIAQKKEITTQMPILKKKYLKSSNYQNQQINDIFSSEELDSAIELDVYQTKSIILQNKGDRFMVQELPWEAQLSPIYALQVIDLDKDGNEDIIFGGNQGKVLPQLGSHQSGLGGVLMSNGEGGFDVISLRDSGFVLKGEIRDFGILKGNGTPILGVVRNNDSIKFYEYGTK